jgi:predicted HicB family RNase H-like nuclease
MKQVTIRIDMRVSEEMHGYLSDAANARKLSYEGLLIEIIQERMDRERQEQLRVKTR